MSKSLVAGSGVMLAQRRLQEHRNGAHVVTSDDLQAQQKGTRRLRVRHETVYRYQGTAALGYSVAWLTPREMPGQILHEHRLAVSPRPRFQHQWRDGFGNIESYFEVQQPHAELTITSQAEVSRSAAPDLGELVMPWEQARPGVGAGDAEPPPWEFCYATERIPEVAAITAYARGCFAPGRPVGEALAAYNAQIWNDFKYLPGATEVDTPLAEAWHNRAGVCQDFAHVAIAGLRGLGLAAAYISGYILTANADDAGARHGADASHAWFAVWLPGVGWVHFDPTNNLTVGDEHIVVALARDYSDTPPVKGVCFGGGRHELAVSVSVEDVSGREVSILA